METAAIPVRFYTPAFAGVMFFYCFEIGSIDKPFSENCLPP